jgi:hypothetical protein
MNAVTIRTPIHLWIVGVLSLLWNSVGAFDYTATQFRIESYMSQFTPGQLEYFYGFPVWMDAAWAIAIWSSLLGSIALLFRKALAAWLFGVAILGLAVSSVYNFVLSNGMEIMGSGAAMFTAVIWVIALFLYFYASAMHKRRVLN